MSDSSFSDDFLDSLVISDTKDLRDTIRQNVLATSPINPDQYAEATRLGRSQNVPPRFVAADFDRYKNNGKIDDTLLDNIVTNAPAYYDWLAQQDNMALTHDDVGGLTFAMDRVRFIAASLVGDVAGRTIEGTGGQLNALAYLSAEGAMKRQQYEREKWNGQRTMFLPDIMPEAVDRALGTASIGLLSMAGDTLELSGSSFRRFADWMAPPEQRRNTFDAFLGGLTQGVSTLAMTAINRPMAIISTLAQGSTQAMDEADAARAQGKQVDERGEAIGTLTAGVITSATEMPVMDAILKRFPQADAIFKAVPDQFKKPAFEFIGKLALAGGAEGLQEAGEGFLRRINTQTFINPEREDYSLNEATGDASLGASVGATLQGLVYLALHISNRRVPHAMEEQVNRELQKEQVKQTAQAIRDTKLNIRDPVKMAEVLKAGNTEGKRVTLDGTIVQQFYQSGINPDEFFNLAPSAREQFEQAQVAGTDVSIPLDEFLHAITAAPENTYDFMTDFMKVDPDADPSLQGWDMSNQDDVNAFIQQALRQSRQDWDSENETVPNTIDVQIERKLRDMLMNSEVMGEKVRNAEAAATEASALAAYFRTRLSKGGEAAERVFMARILSEGAFSVEGPQTTLKKRIGTGSAYYDRLRKKVMADKRVADRKLAGGKRSRRKATKTPLMNAIIARGGIREDGYVASELRHMGITPKTHRKLFKNGTLNNLDNIPAAELEEDLGTQGVFSTDAEYNSYAPEQEILEAIRNEASGDYIRSDDELAAENIEAQQQELLDTLEQEGVDITTATAEQIDAAIDSAATRYRLEYETAQPGSFYQSSQETDYRWTDDPRAGITYQKEIADGVYFEAEKSMRENLNAIPDEQFSELEFSMYDAADEYISKMRGAVNDILSENGHEIIDQDQSRQSHSVYWEVGKKGEDDPDETIKVRFSDHGDFHGGNDVLTFWGALPSDIAKETLEKIGVKNPRVFYQSAREDVTESEAFKKWFGDSKVVDADGKPLVVYHGTGYDFEAFENNRDGTENIAGFTEQQGLYFTKDEQKASFYAVYSNGKDGARVLPVYLSIKNPKIVTYSILDKIKSAVGGKEAAKDAKKRRARESYRFSAKQVKDLEEQGYDGVINEVSGEIIAFSPSQIKSVNNRGTFDKNDARILYQNNNARIQFTDRGQTIIKLFQGADETSLMHEAGHLFLDLDAEIARQPDAPEAFKQEFADTLQWLGVQNFADVSTQHHEKFARGFEAYLYRGEAPSIALKSVFQRMKLWFTNLYRSIAMLGVDINPQMKGVYDRLLATDDEIEAARGNPLGGIEQLTLEMLNKPQREAYLRQNENDMAEAKDKLFRKAYRQLMRQKTEWWKEESGRVQAEVETELQAQNIYRAIQFLQTGNDFNGEPLADNMTTFKMDEAAIVAAFGGDPAIAREELKYLPRGIRTTEGGVDPEIIADMFGFASASEMLRAMQKVPPYKQAVARQTEDRMIAKHGDMLNDGTIDDEALAMVMAETTKREQIILKALAQKTGAAYPSDGDFARAAALAIGRLSVDQAVKPEKYYRAALKAARDYGRALAKKDWESAAEAKRREIMNKHLHKLSKAMREETSKTIDKFNALKKEPPKRDAKKVKIDPDYHQKIWDILDKYDIGPKLSEAKRTRIEMAAMNDWIQRQIDDDGAALIMPQVLLDADRKTHYRDMTVDEFRGLRELVTNLETQGRNKRKWQTKQEKADLDERAALMAATAENSAAKEFQPNDTSNPIGWGKSLINSLDVISTKMAQVMTMMDGGDNFGVWMRSLYNPINQSVIERGMRLRTEYEKFNVIMKGYMDGLGFRYLNQQVGSYHIGTAKLTRENMLMIAMYYTGTPATRQKLVDGYEAKHGWDEAHIERILENMTEKDWNFVMDVRDYLNGFWPETSAVEASRFGYAPEKQEFLEDQQVKTADGKTITVRGGYMRIYYDPDQSVEASNNQVKETFEDMKVFKSARSATKNGSMIEQVDGVKRPMLLSMDNISSHIQETVTHITMAETIDNALKLMRHKDVQQTLFKYLGREGKQMIDLWLQDVVAGGALSGGTINRWLRSVRSNYTIGRLSFRPLTALIQVSGLFQTAADSDLRPHVFGALANYAGMGELTKKDIMESSVFMRERRFALNRDISDAITYYRQKGKYVREKVAVIGLWALQKVQEQVDIITWTAGYRYATERGFNRDDAITYADNAVDRLQGGGNVTNLAGVERGTLHTTTQRQEWVKASFPFYSYFNAKYNILKNTNIKYQNGEISGLDVAISYTLAMLVEGFVSAALMGQLDFDDDDDDEISGGEAAWGMAKIAMGQYAASVPFLRDAASGADGFTSQKGPIGAVIGLGELTGTLVRETDNAIEGEDVNGQKIFRQAVDAINVFVPIPAGAINQFARGVQKEQDGDDPSVLDYLVYRQ